MKNTIKNFILAMTAVVVLSAGSISSAQTTTTTNWLILTMTGVIVLAGAGYLLRKPHNHVEEQ